MPKANTTDLRARLQDSVNERDRMEKLFGFIPMSILRIGRGSLSKSLFQYVGEEVKRNVQNDPVLNNKRARLEKAGLRNAYIFPSMIGTVSATGGNRGARTDALGLSIMPAELVRFFALYYSKPGDTYLDPFMGQGVQLQVAKLLGMNYYGYDLCREFCAYIDAVIPKIDDGTTTIRAYCADSKHPDQIPDYIGDFSFHSPPYWDIEYYDNNLEQLGTGHSYDEFLDGMQQVASAWLPKFKSGAYHVVNVNDFRRDGKLYNYHGDTIALFKAAGWLHVDTWIIDGLVGGLTKAFAVSFNNRKIAPKIHEYAAVFKCP